MVLHTPGQPLRREERPIPTPGAHQLLIKVLACGVCDQALFTGCHLDGGYAEYAVADQRFCSPIPQALSNTEAGAKWSGSSDQPPPHLLDASLIFAPVGALVPLALAATVKGGCVICAGIHMSDIPTFPFRLLWGERSVRSVANLTRDDGTAFFKELQHTPVHCDTTRFSLDGALSGLLKHHDLMAHITGMLARHPWNHPFAPAVRPVASAAWWDAPLRQALVKDHGTSSIWRPGVRLHGSLARKIVSQFGNLSLGQIGQSPHVPAVCFSATSMVFEVGQLQLQILVLLARQLGKLGRDRLPRQPMSVVRQRARA